MEQSPTQKIQNANKEGNQQIDLRCAFDSIADPRHENEDTTLVDTGRGIFGIFDGMGGHMAGDEASEIACTVILDHLSEISNGMDVESARKTLTEIMIKADMALCIESEKRRGKEDNAESTSFKRMGTTASILKIHTDKTGKHYGLIANIGDSRIYKINKDNEIEQITTDNDLLERNQFNLGKEKSKRISKKISEAKKLEELDSEEISYFRQRNKITKYIGQGNEFSGVFSIRIEKGDRFLITSDGVHDNLTTQEIEETIKQSPTIKDASKNLTQKASDVSKLAFTEEGKALNFRAKQDDISVVIVEIN